MEISKHALIIFCHLKKTIVLCAFLSLSSPKGFSQFSISAGYKSFFPKGWSDSSIRYRSTTLYPMFGWGAGIDYKLFRAKLYRIELTPTVLYSHFNDKANNLTGTGNWKTIKVLHEQFTLQFNVSSYIFDFFGDITDPRHTESVGFLKSHTFFEIAPIYIHYRNKTFTTYPKYSSSKVLGIGNTIGGSFGLGLDLPLPRSHVLNLLIRYCYFPDYDRIGDGNHSPSSTKSDLRQFFIGCRFRL